MLRFRLFPGLVLCLVCLMCLLPLQPTLALDSLSAAAQDSVSTVPAQDSREEPPTDMPLVRLKGGENEIVLGPYLQTYRDAERQLTYTEVKRLPFMANEQAVVNRGFDMSNHWLRFRIKNETGQDGLWLLDLAWPVLTEVDLYTPDTTFLTGEDRYYGSRPLDNRNYVFPIRLKAGEEAVYYMRIFSTTPNIFPLTLYTQAGFAEADLLDWALTAIFFGAVLIMLLYNLLLYATVRDREYLPYIGYLLFTGIFMLSFRGLGFQYLWPESPWLNAFTRIALPSAAAFSLSIFIKLFLGTRTRAPMLHHALTAYQVFSAVIFLLMCYQENKQLTFITDQMMNASIGIMPLLAFTVGVYVYRRGYKPAQFYLVAFSFLLIGLIIQILKNFNVLTHNLFTEYTFQYGILLEQAVLSIALGDKINLFKEEKEAAQEEAIEALKANEKLIAEQNRVLEQKVAERTLELQEANNELEEKNRDILDSINYARRIQTAILPPIAEIRSLVPDLEVFYRPKDIVSGDFYWFASRDRKAFIAAVDCTGHGVPGAFMSVIGYNQLNRIVVEKGITKPSEILYHLDAGVRQLLHQDGEQTSNTTADGMDLSLCVVDLDTGMVEYAGANRPIWLLRYGELIEVKGDKFPIGGGQYADKVFTTLPIQPEAEDTFYIYSDGVVDQFGHVGEATRKFGTKRLRELILKLQDRPLPLQIRAIEDSFDQWRNGHEQLDDVTFIAFRVPKPQASAAAARPVADSLRPVLS